jgi:hypothetical protein
VRVRVGLTPAPGGTAGLLTYGSALQQAYAAPASVGPGPPSSSRDSDVVAFSSPRTLAAADSAERSAEQDSSTFEVDTTTTTTSTTTTPATPSGPPPEITGVRTLSLTPFAAQLGWETSEATSSRVAYGLETATLWTPAGASAVTHSGLVTGLAPSTTYRVWVAATTEDGRTATAPYYLTTPALNHSPTPTIKDGAILLDGQPTFPRMVWAQCPDGFGRAIGLGIDVFMGVGNGCGSTRQAVEWLGGSGFMLANMSEGAVSGAIGSYLPDEWDTHLPNNLTTEQVRNMIPASALGPRYLTLTNHFYSLAEPLPQGRGMYPALIANADVIGFDLYPLQNWCRWDSFHDVFESQRELVALAGGKPTFQWIEVRRMDCPGGTLDVTPETVRAETWLAIAGGAHAIGYFPHEWKPEVGEAIARANREIRTLAPALVEPNLPASVSEGNKIKVGVRQHAGALYVIAVNSSRAAAATGTISVPALGNRSLTTLDGSRAVTAAGGRFTDTFAPLEVRIYIAAPVQQ